MNVVSYWQAHSTGAFEFRRCPACGQINLIKDAVFHCDACDAELPRVWNFGHE